MSNMIQRFLIYIKLYIHEVVFMYIIHLIFYMQILQPPLIVVTVNIISGHTSQFYKIPAEQMQVC